MVFNTKYINAEIERLKKLDKALSAIAPYARNLNLLVCQRKISAVYNREEVVRNIQKTMLRKNKGNVLLTGAAGCGKTAIAEALARDFVYRALSYREESAPIYTGKRDADGDKVYSYPEVSKPMFSDYVVYELVLNSVVSGTKYRGEFEEKLRNILEEVAQYPNVILFMDEIHQISTIGAAEGATNMGQILKPALARGDIHVIGATTTDEYVHIEKDKALARRFTRIDVQEIKGADAIACTEKVLNDYAEHFGIKVNGVSAEDIYSKVKYFLPKTVFPNNVIDIIDETLAGAKFDELTEIDKSHFYATLGRMAGVIIM